MALKPRFKRRIFWTAISVVGACAAALVIVPPFFTLNKFKPKIQDAISAQMGVDAQIRGDVHFSLVGRTTISVQNVVVPDGEIRAVMFAVPLRDLLDLSDAKLDGDVDVYGATLRVSSLAPILASHNIRINNSTVEFLGKDYDVIRGQISDGKFTGIVRTDQHKYDISVAGDMFRVRNNTVNLDIVGRLYSDGTARGEMSIDTDKINQWFQFDVPRIRGRLKLAMNFDWDGKYGFKFTDIRGDNFAGNIELFPDGARRIQITSDNADFDFSFLADPMRVFYKTQLDLNLRGRLKFGDQVFSRLVVRADGTRTRFDIEKIIADGTTITGGWVGADGAHDIDIATAQGACLFSGTPEKWQCARFTSATGLRGAIFVDDGFANVRVSAPEKMGANAFAQIKTIAPRGRVEFSFADAAGTMNWTGGRETVKYTRASDRTAAWAGADFPFLPARYRDARGDVVWDGDVMRFTPYSGEFELVTHGNRFAISGRGFKAWFVDADLIFIDDAPYSISGNWSGRAVSDLRIDVAGHVFTGSAAGRTVTLNTDMLNLDAFVSQDYLDRFEELQFLSPHPIAAGFALPADVSLTADTVMWGGNEFRNFAYAARGAVQTMSITDDARGNLLATIERSGNKYDISIQVAHFATHGNLLRGDMPLNVRDTTVTGEVSITTSGGIAYDVIENISADVDIVLDGGYLVGIGTDDFYAAASAITTMNAEMMLARALSGGVSGIKKIRVVGKYSAGTFETTAPLELGLRHVDGTGTLRIGDGAMTANLRLVMRGTSPMPAPIALRISGVTRDYSLSEIMNGFDADYLRTFVTSHNAF